MKFYELALSKRRCNNTANIKAHWFNLRYKYINSNHKKTNHLQVSKFSSEVGLWLVPPITRSSWKHKTFSRKQYHNISLVIANKIKAHPAPDASACNKLSSVLISININKKNRFIVYLSLSQTINLSFQKMVSVIVDLLKVLIVYSIHKHFPIFMYQITTLFWIYYKRAGCFSEIVRSFVL